MVITDDLAAARDVVRARPELRVVTRDGDLLGAHWAHGGSARPPSMLAMRAAAEEASAAQAAAEQAAQEAAATLASALADEERDREVTGRALAGMRAADKAAAESSGRLGRLAGAARAAQEEAARLEAAITSITEQREREAAALAGVVARLEEAEAGEDGGPEAGQAPDAPQAPDRESLTDRASAACVHRAFTQDREALGEVPRLVPLDRGIVAAQLVADERCERDGHRSAGEREQPARRMRSRCAHVGHCHDELALDVRQPLVIDTTRRPRAHPNATRKKQ